MKLAELPEKYPELFGHQPTEHPFRFGCDEGWCNLLDRLLGIIKHRLSRYREVVEIRQGILDRGEEPLPWIAEFFEKSPVDPLDCFSIMQIKEKFGGLRFYASFGGAHGQAIDACHGAIDLAESLSYTICEICGMPGSCRAPGGERLKAYAESLSNGAYIGGGFVQTLCDEHHTTKELRIIYQREVRLRGEE